MAAGDGGNGQYGGMDFFGMPSSAYASTGAGGSPPVAGMADDATAQVTIPLTNTSYQGHGGTALNGQLRDGFLNQSYTSTGAGEGSGEHLPRPNAGR
jgi:hypothetical protein